MDASRAFCAIQVSTETDQDQSFLFCLYSILYLWCSSEQRRQQLLHFAPGLPREI
jgi:hypothetical protein